MGEEKSNATSFEDAMNLIVSSIEHSKGVLHIKSLDKDYVEGVFRDTLLNKKLSEINDKTQVYTTEQFRITASCEYERMRVITNFKLKVLDY